MGARAKELTEREKAAIYYHVATNCRVWKDTYINAFDGEIREAEKSPYLETYVSRWKNSKGVQDYLQDVQYKLKRKQEDHDAEIIRKYQEEQNQRQRERDALQEIEGGKEGRRMKREGGPIDYSDPEQQRKKLNQLINEADDDKSALDALKLIISTQKDDREAAKEQKTVRAYLPVTCDICPLYQKAKK